MSGKKGFFSRLFGERKSGNCGCGQVSQGQTGNCCGAEGGMRQKTEEDACTCKKQREEASILILGSGCKNCRTLEENTRIALQQIGDTTSVIGHVTDFEKIAGYGVMRTPGLVVNGKAVSAGQVLNPEEIAEILKREME